MTERDNFKFNNLAAITSCIVSLGYGTAITWTSPAIPYLISESSHLKLTKQQADTTSSLIIVGFVIGYFLNPLIVDRLGSKRTLLLYSIPQIISWLLIFLAENYIAICIARILCGISYGAGICTLTIYLSEISNPYTRGKFISFLNLAMGLGFFLVMLLGASLQYNYMNLVLLSTPIVFLATFIFIPDSPRFPEEMNPDEFNIMGKIKSASVQNEKPAGVEFGEGERFLRKNPEREQKNRREDSKCFALKESNIWKLITLSNNRKALFIVISIAAQDVFSGHTVLWAYLQHLLNHKGSIIYPERATLFLAIAKILAATLSSIILGIMRRRSLILVTGIIGALALAFTSTFFFLEENGVDVSCIRWAPLIGLTTYELSFSIGTTNFFYLYQAELFSPEVKSVAIMVSKVSYMIFSYLCIFRLLVLLDAIGKSVIFLIGTIVAGLGTLFVFYITPETKGKSMKEVQEILKRKKFSI